MKTAYLDCVNKTLKVEIAGENFTLELSGNKTEIGTVRTKQGDFLTHFDFNQKNPEFLVGKKTDAMNYIQKANTHLLLEDKETYKVYIDKGSREDYFGVKFPQGINSYLTTYGIMMREVDGLTSYNSFNQKVTSTGVLEFLQKWALEFETSTIDREWEGDYEDEVVEFLINQIKTVI